MNASFLEPGGPLARLLGLSLSDLAAVPWLPLLYALALGGLIGLEREWHGRPAGLRTHALVCVSSTILTLISQATSGADVELGEAGRVVFDPNRMGAGIVTGIGFLGAATVLRSGDFLRGLTTAACIWFVAALGIVLGNHAYALGLVSTGIVLFVLTALNWATALVRPVLYRRLIVLHARSDVEGLTAEVRTILNEMHVRLLDIASGHDNEDGPHELVFFVSLKNKLQSPVLTERVAALRGVASARWKQISTTS